MEIQTDTLLFGRLALAAVFFVAGAAKLADIAGSRNAIVSFGFPQSLAAPLGIALPAAELATAFALLPAASARSGAIASLVLLTAFIAGITNVIAKGREADCHCFGQLHSSRIGFSTLIRNVVLALIAGFIVISGGTAPAPSFIDRAYLLDGSETLVILSALLIVALFSTGAWFMANLLKQHGRLLNRLDVLEEQLALRGLFARSDYSDAPDGLEPGITAPAFSLPGLDGAIVTLSDLLAPRLPLVLVFSHPGCTPCTVMLPELASWQRSHSADLSIAFISQGSIEANRPARDYEVERILLQELREIAESYEAYATPSAVLVSPDGKIASHVVQGEAAIRVLISSAAMRSDSAGPNAVHSASPAWHDRISAPISQAGLDVA